jgi:hypothetical protein
MVFIIVFTRTRHSLPFGKRQDKIEYFKAKKSKNQTINVGPWSDVAQTQIVLQLDV